MKFTSRRTTVTPATTPLTTLLGIAKAVGVGGAINTLRDKLSQTCYSRDTPARGTRGPYKVCDNLHSIARIKDEMPS